MVDLTAATAGRLVSVNLGRPYTAEWLGRRIRTSIVRAPVDHRVAAGAHGLEGNLQANLKVHGGIDKAVYAYAVEDYAWWSARLGAALSPGTFGENLTTEGMDLSAALVGERWSVGSCVLEVAGPRTPCATLGMRMGDPGFPSRFVVAGRPGAYMRVTQPGELGTGDLVQRLFTPVDGVTVAEVAAGRARRSRERGTE